MATLTPLKANPGDTPSATITAGSLEEWDRGASVWADAAALTAANAAARLDETITSSEASGDTGIGLAAGANATASIDIPLTSVNGDFLSMSTLSINFSAAQFGSYGDDDAYIALAIMSSSGVSCYANANGVNSTSVANFLLICGRNAYASAGAPAYNLTKGLTLTSSGASADKASWDSAKIRIEFLDTRQMGTDTSALIFVDFQLTGTYTPVRVPAKRYLPPLPRGNFINSTRY